LKATEFGEITHGKAIRRSRSSKVAYFGTNRKLIYDFLLVINTNLPLYLALLPSYGRLFICQISLAIGDFFTLTHSLGVIPCENLDKLYLFRNVSRQQFLHG